ncbi:hypothetical protein JHD49_03405 [Sulfurimonas sp. SAG-AH-194-C21]|nr:hypothetical protein [Sulfurimonas sp. SAG-AH-194-C21]MDF1882976.1 hypothetical protein [Sulfurimonas sp. SAG-AH-194-C21]
MSLKKRVLKLEAIVKVKDKREIVSYGVIAIKDISEGTGHIITVLKS